MLLCFKIGNIWWKLSSGKGNLVAIVEKSLTGSEKHQEPNLKAIEGMELMRQPRCEKNQLPEIQTLILLNDV